MTRSGNSGVSASSPVNTMRPSPPKVGHHEPPSARKRTRRSRPLRVISEVSVPALVPGLEQDRGRDRARPAGQRFALDAAFVRAHRPPIAELRDEVHVGAIGPKAGIPKSASPLHDLDRRNIVAPYDQMRHADERESDPALPRPQRERDVRRALGDRRQVDLRPSEAQAVSARCRHRSRGRVPPEPRCRARSRGEWRTASHCRRRCASHRYCSTALPARPLEASRPPETPLRRLRHRCRGRRAPERRPGAPTDRCAIPWRRRRRSRCRSPTSSRTVGPRSDLPGDRPPAQPPDHPDRLEHDLPGHLALPLGAVVEDDRNLDDPELLSPG